jgi:hypothetical protein
MVARMNARAEALGATLSYFGASRTLDLAVLDFPFTLWQYGDDTLCAQIPPADATVEELYGFLGGDDVELYYSDEVLDAYAPYYFQAATELGAPTVRQDYLLDLMSGGVPVDASPAVFPPYGMDKVFNPARMVEVQDWVNTAGSRLMFLYGAQDPWTAGAFTINPSLDQVRFTVTGRKGNHLAGVADLPEAERRDAIFTLRRWMGTQGSSGGLTSADDVTLEADQTSRVYLRQRHSGALPRRSRAASTTAGWSESPR